MTVTINLTIDDAALRKALQDPKLIAGPLKDFLAKSALNVEAEAKQVAPVDTGRLRASITSVLEPTRAHVQTSVFYAAHVEFGTRPHFPPPAALQPWARRHGFASGWALAMWIAKHGTKPHPFMRPAAVKSLPRIREFLVQMAQDIERRWKGGK